MRNPRPAWIASLVLATAAWSPGALALDPERPLLHATIDVWGRREGLPSLGIDAIAQGSEGYLWLATEGGLVRFDGMRFVVFDPDSAPALRTAMIEDVVPLENGALLVATYDGLYRFENGRIEPLETPREHRRYTTLVRDGGRVLAIHPEGIDAVEGTRVTPIPLREREGGSTRIAMRLAAPDGAGGLWIVADNGKRLLRWNGKDDVVEDGLTARGAARVAAMTRDGSGAVWLLASPGGLLRRAGSRFETVAASPLLEALEGARLFVDRQGSAWISSSDGTLVRARGGRLDVLPGARRLLGGAEIRALADDSEGSLWIASSGLYRLRDSSVVTLSEPEGWPAGSISNVFADSRGRLWVAAQPGGLVRPDGETWRSVTDGLPRGVPVLSITEDRSGAVWFGTAANGLYWIDEKGLRHPAAPDRKRDIVMGLSPCPSGRCVFAGMTSGFWTVRPDSALESPFVGEGEIDPAVVAVHSDRAGRIWAGTSGHGIFVRPGHVASWKPVAPDRIGGLVILSFTEDEDGTLWVGTVDGGLLRVRGDEVRALGHREGLPSDTVYAVLVGDGEEIWLSTPSGIARASRRQLNAAADGALAKVECLVLGYDDGLRAGECNGGGRVATRAPDGRLYFATPQGVAYVDPRKLERNPVPPRVVVEDLSADGVPVALGPAPARLAAGTEHCEIRYTALSLRAPGRVRFKYRLEGLEGTWTEAAGGERVARYSQPPPGDYVFRVLAANEHGVWSEEGATLRFSVAPHPWQTGWFWAIAGACLVGAVYSAHRLRLRAFVRKQDELERAIAARTAELAETNRTLEERVEEGIATLRNRERLAAYGEMVAGVAHEVRHPIFSIRAAAHLITRKTAGAKEEIAAPLGVLERETERMARLMDDLLQFARPPELTRAPLDVRRLLEEAVTAVHAADPSWPVPIAIEADDVSGATWDHDRMLQVLVNLLENARKHAAGARRLALRARRDGEGTIALEVEDDGAGMEADVAARIFEPFFTRGAGTGLGLAIVARIVREHGGTIGVESSPGRGTRFGMRIPVGYAIPA
jgi:signal transduction histidine kinase/ligand-binding sensor domain-containing protein